MTSNTLTAEAQTYPIDCGVGVKGNKVRVRLEETDKPLEIAEIGVIGYRKISELQDFNTCMEKSRFILAVYPAENL